MLLQLSRAPLGVMLPPSSRHCHPCCCQIPPKHISAALTLTSTLVSFCLRYLCLDSFSSGEGFPHGPGASAPRHLRPDQSRPFHRQLCLVVHGLREAAPRRSPVAVVLLRIQLIQTAPATEQFVLFTTQSIFRPSATKSDSLCHCRAGPPP